MKECCENCRFWDGSMAYQPSGSRAYFSYCLRYPPVLSSLGWEGASEPENWCHPTVSEVQWCGEWKPIPLREEQQGDGSEY